MSKVSVRKLSHEQLAMQGLCGIGLRKSHMRFHFTVDLSNLIQKVDSDEKLSTSATLIKTIADVLVKHPLATSMIGKSDHLHSFDSIDVFAPVLLKNKEIKGHIFRAVETTSAQDLSDQFRQVQQLEQAPYDASQEAFFKLPRRVRDWYFRYVFKRPYKAKAFFGNVLISCFFGDQDFCYGDPFHTMGIYISKPDSAGKANIVFCGDHAIMNGTQFHEILQDIVAQLTHEDV